MRLGIGEAEADRDEVEERRVGEFGAPAAKIVPGMEDELEPAGARFVRLTSGLSVRPSALVTTSATSLRSDPSANS